MKDYLPLKAKVPRVPLKVAPLKVTPLKVAPRKVGPLKPVAPRKPRRDPRPLMPREPPSLGTVRRPCTARRCFTDIGR